MNNLELYFEEESPDRQEVPARTGDDGYGHDRRHRGRPDAHQEPVKVQREARGSDFRRTVGQDAAAVNKRQAKRSGR